MKYRALGLHDGHAEEATNKEVIMCQAHLEKKEDELSDNFFLLLHPYSCTIQFIFSSSLKNKDPKGIRKTSGRICLCYWQQWINPFFFYNGITSSKFIRFMDICSFLLPCSHLCRMIPSLANVIPHTQPTTMSARRLFLLWNHAKHEVFFSVFFMHTRLHENEKTSKNEINELLLQINQSI